MPGVCCCARRGGSMPSAQGGPLGGSALRGQGWGGNTTAGGASPSRPAPRQVIPRTPSHSQKTVWGWTGQGGPQGPTESPSWSCVPHLSWALSPIQDLPGKKGGLVGEPSPPPTQHLTPGLRAPEGLHQHVWAPTCHLGHKGPPGHLPNTPHPGLAQPQGREAHQLSDHAVRNILGYNGPPVSICEVPTIWGRRGWKQEGQREQTPCKWQGTGCGPNSPGHWASISPSVPRGVGRLGLPCCSSSSTELGRRDESGGREGEEK